MNTSTDYPQFSVLVNNYNYGAYLGEALDSVLPQLLDTDELIVVDDGSTDDSISLLNFYRSDSRVKIIEQKNQGQISAVWNGIHAAQGDIVVLLDSDDYFLPGYLQRLRTIYCQNPDISFVFARPEVGGVDQKKNDAVQIMVDRMAFPAGPIGPTKWSTLMSYEFAGMPTSGISLHTRLARKITELPDDIHEVSHLSPLQQRLLDTSGIEGAGVRLSADGLIVRCASALAALKYFSDTPGFFYRIHQDNKFAGTSRLQRWYHRAHRQRQVSALLRNTFDLPARPTTSELKAEIVQRRFLLDRRRRLKLRLFYCLSTIRSRGSIIEKIATGAAIFRSR